MDGILHPAGVRGAPARAARRAEVVPEAPGEGEEAREGEGVRITSEEPMAEEEAEAVAVGTRGR